MASKPTSKSKSPSARSRPKRRPGLALQVREVLWQRYTDVYIHSAYNHAPPGKRIPTEYRLLINLRRRTRVPSETLSAYLRNHLPELPEGIAFARVSHATSTKPGSFWYLVRFKRTKATTSRARAKKKG